MDGTCLVSIHVMVAKTWLCLHGVYSINVNRRPMLPQVNQLRSRHADFSRVSNCCSRIWMSSMIGTQPVIFSAWTLYSWPLLIEGTKSVWNKSWILFKMTVGFSSIWEGKENRQLMVYDAFFFLFSFVINISSNLLWNLSLALTTLLTCLMEPAIYTLRTKYYCNNQKSQLWFLYMLQIIFLN